MKDLDARDLVSDAGDMLVGVTEFKDGVEDVSKRMQEPLCEGDLGESSMYRELRALEMAIETRGESLAGQAVRWVTDSQSAVTILKVGSMKPRCHAVAVRVWGLGSFVWHHALLYLDAAYFHRDHGRGRPEQEL